MGACSANPLSPRRAFGALWWRGWRDSPRCLSPLAVQPAIRQPAEQQAEAGRDTSDVASHQASRCDDEDAQDRGDGIGELEAASRALRRVICKQEHHGERHAKEEAARYTKQRSNDECEEHARFISCPRQQAGASSSFTASARFVAGSRRQRTRPTSKPSQQTAPTPMPKSTVQGKVRGPSTAWSIGLSAGIQSIR